MLRGDLRRAHGRAAGAESPGPPARTRRRPPRRRRTMTAPAELKTEAVADVDAHADVHAADGRSDLQLRRARLPGIRDQPLPDRHPRRRTASPSRKGVAGIPTAFVATWGSGKPVIALGSDIDGIPQASQKPGVAYHDPMIEGAPGHGEGHNSGQALNITAALAVKKIMEREKLPGTIRIWTGTAEELVGTKAYFIRAGLFKDVDVALFTHVGDDLGVSWGDRAGTGLVSVQYSFRGETRARRRRAVARPQRARRGRADGHRLELPPRAPAARAALALRDHRRRRSAQRRAAHRVGLVLLPRRPTTRRSRSCGRPATRSPRARR